MSDDKDSSHEITEEPTLEITEQMPLDLDEDSISEKSEPYNLTPEPNKEKKPTTALTRVLKEQTNLADKIAKLTEGLSNPKLSQLAHKHLLQQRVHMQGYLDMLATRISSSYWD